MGKTLSASHARWLENRKIDAEIASRMGVYSAGPMICIPYYRDGVELFSKRKNLMAQEGAGWLIEWEVPEDQRELVLWNENVLHHDFDPGQPLVIAEGEWDALALMTAGYANVISPPNGAKSTKEVPEFYVDDNTFAWLWGADRRNMLAMRKHFDRVVLFMDDDDAGRACRDDLTLRILEEHTWVVTDYHGRNDANEILIHDGAKALRASVDKAKSTLISEAVGAFDIPIPPKPTPYSTGFEGLDAHLKVTFPSLVVVTGAPGSGKSQWMRNLACNLSERGHFGTLFVPENGTWRVLEDLMRHYGGMHGKTSDKAEHARRRKILSQRIRLLPNPKGGRTIGNIMQNIRAEAIAHNRKWFIIDPWSRVNHAGQRELREDLYVSDTLAELHELTQELRIMVVIVAHPTKLRKTAGGDYEEASMYDISGGAHWNNAPDFGLVFHRPYKGRYTNLIIEKLRETPLTGTPGAVCSFVFNPDNATFTFVGLKDEERAAA